MLGKLKSLFFASRFHRRSRAGVNRFRPVVEELEARWVPTLQTVDMVSGDAFSPQNITIMAGDSIQWTNLDSISHTATSGTGGVSDGKWDTGTVLPGNTSAAVLFSTAGTFPYFC